MKEGDELFKGTIHEGRWFLFHDSLSLWTATDAQKYLATILVRERQVRPRGEAASDEFGIYKDRLVGNRPENCRALDAHGFADLVAALKRHVAISRAAGIDEDDEKAFAASTPKRLWSALVRVWTVAPTAEQIEVYIRDWPRVLGLIVKADGCIVPEENIRRGVRAEGTKRDRKRGNKKTNKPRVLHKHLLESDAVKQLFDGWNAEVVLDELPDDYGNEEGEGEGMRE